MTKPPNPTVKSTSRMEPAIEGTTTDQSPLSPSLQQPQSANNPSSIPTEINPWLSIPYKKPSKNPTSQNRIEKLQAKHNLAKDSATDSTIHIDVSVDSLNAKLAALQRDKDTDNREDDESLGMTYAVGKIAFEQAELISRAFASDALEADFTVEKEAAIAEDAPREEDLTLPGWGSWTGRGVKKRRVEKKLVKLVPGIDAAKRKDAKLKHVIINEKIPKKVLCLPFHSFLFLFFFCMFFE
jgi:U3 small nucleolar RNA-associated protein 14